MTDDIRLSAQEIARNAALMERLVAALETSQELMATAVAAGAIDKFEYEKDFHARVHDNRTLLDDFAAGFGRTKAEGL